MQAAEPHYGSSGLRAEAGSFNLDSFPKACPGQARSLELSCGFRVPFTASERRKGPLALMVNQGSVPKEGIRVFFFPRCLVMGWPWISGPETELVGNLGFHLSRTVLWRLMLKKAHHHFGGPTCPLAPSQKRFPTNPLSAPPQKDCPLAWWKSRGWTLFSALGRLRLSPRIALAQTITPFKKLRWQ